MIQRLQADRQKHLDAIADIDDTLSEHGISSSPRRRRRKPGRPRGGKKTAARRKAGRKKITKKRRKKGKVAKRGGKKQTGRKKGKKKAAKKRRSFGETGDPFILDLLKGGKRMTTAQLNAKWKQARRGGTANNTLSKLTSQRKLKRENIKDGRRSSYSLAKRGGKKKATKKKVEAK